MLCEDFLPDHQEALRVIRKHGCLEERYLKRFEIALRDSRLSPDKLRGNGAGYSPDAAAAWAALQLGRLPPNRFEPRS